MKILIITTHYKPGFKAGGPIQSVFNFAKLLGKWAEIYVLTKSNDLGSTTKYKVEENKWLPLADHQVKYLDKDNFNIPAILNEVKELNINVIYFNSFFENYTWRFLLYNRFNFLKIKIIIAPRGQLDLGALKIKKYKKVFFLNLIKIFLRKNVNFHATTPQENSIISSHFTNVVKTALNVPQIIEIKPEKELKVVNQSNFVFISRISPKKNLKYCIELLLCLQIDGILNFDIIGPKEDEKYWNEVELLTEKLPTNIIVNYLGEYRNEDLKTKTTKYHFLFFPTLAENYGHIIYECLSYGIPVLISDRTPWKQDDNGVFVSELENKNKFIKLLKHLHSLDQREYNIESNNAFTFAKNYNNLSEIENSYKSLFNGDLK